MLWNVLICIFFSPSDNLIITDLHALLTPTSNSTSPAVIGGAHMSLKHSVLRITLQLSRLVLRLYYISYCGGVALENEITGCSYSHVHKVPCCNLAIHKLCKLKMCVLFYQFYYYSTRLSSQFFAILKTCRLALVPPLSTVLWFLARFRFLFIIKL